ncbi:unnamed protein product [Nezara viridula]|uniref:Uncharacterized protein n=1 Tax=Nezara viridula TaxID=85310 RepID=A0A9P0E826_NEZVI|nr:unnamed protein product [Nezara viridula]
MEKEKKTSKKMGSLIKMNSNTSNSKDGNAKDVNEKDTGAKNVNEKNANAKDASAKDADEKKENAKDASAKDSHEKKANTKDPDGKNNTKDANEKKANTKDPDGKNNTKDENEKKSNASIFFSFHSDPKNNTKSANKKDANEKKAKTKDPNSKDNAKSAKAKDAKSKENKKKKKTESKLKDPQKSEDEEEEDETGVTRFGCDEFPPNSSKICTPNTQPVRIRRVYYHDENDLADTLDETPHKSTADDLYSPWDEAVRSMRHANVISGLSMAIAMVADVAVNGTDKLTVEKVWLPVQFLRTVMNDKGEIPPNILNFLEHIDIKTKDSGNPHYKEVYTYI